MKQCLYCYLPLAENEGEFHQKCCKKFFGQTSVPLFPSHENTLIQLANQETDNQLKIYFNLIAKTSVSKFKQFEISGEEGEYVLKFPDMDAKFLPQLEDLTLHLASIAGIKVVPHCLMRLSSGNLVSLSRRSEIVKNEKIYFQDLRQLLNLTNDELYDGSYESIIDFIQSHSVNPGLDTVNFFEILLFSFLIGNSEMHYRKFSFIHHKDMGFMLAPFYDLSTNALDYSIENIDFALNFNNKKKNIHLGDFAAVATAAKLSLKQQENILNKMKEAKSHWFEFIDISFLSQELKESYKKLITSRFLRLTKLKS